MLEYFSGEEIHIGQRVTYGCSPGRIVFVVDRDEYSEAYPKEHWAYLHHGFGVELDDGTLFHLNRADEDLELVSP